MHAATERVDAIREFHVKVPESELTIAQTHKRDIADDRKGCSSRQLGLARYWATDYDWRKIRRN